MAAMVLTMLFIGIGMVSTLQPKFLTLIAIHRPLGIAILLLAIFRLGVRLQRGTPPLPADLPRWQAISAKASHYFLYGLLIAMPLIGWSMLSAGGYPIVLGGPIHLPKIMPHNDVLYAFLRSARSALPTMLASTRKTPGIAATPWETSRKLSRTSPWSAPRSTWTARWGPADHETRVVERRCR